MALVLDDIHRCRLEAARYTAEPYAPCSWCGRADRPTRLVPLRGEPTGWHVCPDHRLVSAVPPARWRAQLPAAHRLALALRGFTDCAEDGDRT